jgi:hypothetical protein
MLHQEAILNLMAFVNTLMPPAKPQPVVQPRRASNTRRLSVSSLGSSLGGNLTKGAYLPVVTATYTLEYNLNNMGLGLGL